MSETDIDRFNKEEHKNQQIILAIVLLAAIGIPAVILLFITLSRVWFDHEPPDTFWFLLKWIVVLLAGCSALVYWWPQQRVGDSKIIRPDASGKITMRGQFGEDSTLSILPPDMLNRYDAERKRGYRIAAGLAVMTLVLLAITLYANDLGRWIVFCMYMVIPIALSRRFPALRKQWRDKKALALSAKDTGLILTNEGLRCNIALLYSNDVSHGAVRSFHWNEFQFMSVESLDPTRGGHPAYYKFVLQKPYALPAQAANGSANMLVKCIYILREPFYGREQEIIDYIKAHAGITIEMKDALR